MIIREARVEDAAGIAKVHIDSWRSTYQGMLSAEFLSNLSYERRAQGWRDILNSPQNNSFLYVAEDESGEIVGFVSAGPRQQNVPGLEAYDGEIHAIYLLKESQGQGLGRKLMEAAFLELSARGFNSSLLWVFKDNLASRRFYESLGGRYLMEKSFTLGDQSLMEVAYGWKDIPSSFPSRN